MRDFTPEAFSQEWSATTGVGVILHIAEVEVTPEVGDALSAILQEALDNVAAHARAELVAVSLTRAGGTLTLEVRDDGAGFTPPDPLEGPGLHRMRERAESCGGTLEVTSRPGGGTKVLAVVRAPTTPAHAAPVDKRRLLLVAGAVVVAVVAALLFVVVPGRRTGQAGGPQALPSTSFDYGQPPAPAAPGSAGPTGSSGPSPTATRSRRPSEQPSDPPPVIVAPSVSASASTESASTCKVQYVNQSQWDPGFVAYVTITNTGAAPVGNWMLRFDFPGGQKVTNAWNATVKQAGAAVSAVDNGAKPTLPPGGSWTIGVQGTWQGTNPAPVSFTLNGKNCA